MSKLAVHAQGKFFIDEVFDAVAAVGNATAKLGKDNVTNATIGALCDEQGNLVMLPTVEKVFRSLKKEDIAAYAPVRGLPDYLSAAVQQAFGTCRPDLFIEAVATAGGTGAIHNFIWNYSAVGDAILTHDWHWQPYSVLCSDSLRKLETFPFFDDNQKFNTAAFEQKVKDLLARQDNLTIILNAPNHNPTGYSITNTEWEDILKIINTNATLQKTIALLVDIAYIDYIADPYEARSFMHLFEKLSPHAFAAFAFSMSKGFTLYGQRTGALIGMAKDRQSVSEFVNACVITCRTRWSNLSRAAMKTMGDIYQDPELLSNVGKERAQYIELMKQRAVLFVEEAQNANLKMLPYCGGFFISIPSETPVIASNILRESNIYVVPVAKGLRIAVCAVPVHKIKGMADKVFDAVSRIQ